MSFPSNVPTRIHIPKSPESRTTKEDGNRRFNPSRSCRRPRYGNSGIQVGQQKIVTELFHKSKQETAKYKLFIFMSVLLKLDI